MALWVRGRQGVRYPFLEGLRVGRIDAPHLDVPADGETMGEILLRGNAVGCVESGALGQPSAAAAPGATACMREDHSNREALRGPYAYRTWRAARCTHM